MVYWNAFHLQIAACRKMIGMVGEFISGLCWVGLGRVRLARPAGRASQQAADIVFPGQAPRKAM